MNFMLKVSSFLVVFTSLTIGQGQYSYSSESDSELMHAIISGNSLKIVNRYGVSIVYFNKDGTVLHLGDRGQRSEGIWRASDDGVCTTVLPQPINPPKSFCLVLNNHKFGESWISQDPRNGEIKHTLLRGQPKL